MSLSRLNVVLGILLALSVVLLVVLRVDNSRPNYQIVLGDDMTYSPAYQAMEPSSNFENGRTIQAPVLGTVARGGEPFYFEPTPDDALRAGEQLINPVELGTEAGAAAVEQGRLVFQTFCVACHGGDGAGNGPVAQRGFPPPPSLLAGKSQVMKDGQLFHIITLGQNSMPQFAAQLPPQRRWDVIAYIRSLQQNAEPAAMPPNNASQQREPSASAPEQDAGGEKP